MSQPTQSKSSALPVKPDIRVCPEQQVLYVRRQGLINNDFTQAARSAFAALRAFLDMHHLQDKWQSCVGITPDDPSLIPEAQCRYDAGVILHGVVEVMSDVHIIKALLRLKPDFDTYQYI